MRSCNIHDKLQIYTSLRRFSRERSSSEADSVVGSDNSASLAMEEFTFPRVPLEQCCDAKKLPFPHFASPPQWFVPDAAAARDHRRSFSAIEQAGDNYYYYHHHHGASERFAVEEDKMDMLWEDFNDELARTAPRCPLSKEWAREAWLASDGDGIAAVEMRRRAVASGSVVRRRRLSLLMMLKLLKKLFLAHKSHATSRKAPTI